MRRHGIVGILLSTSLIGMGAQAAGQARANQIWPGMEPGPFRVGYTVMHEYDYSRTFRRKYDFFGERTRRELARPIQISVWYPAQATDSETRVRVREYYDAAATEIAFDAVPKADLDAALRRLAGILAMEWHVSAADRPVVLARLDSVFQEETYAWREATPAAGRFPLVLHLPGYNGSPNDFPPLFEYLASHGYVVAAIPNMGAYSRQIDDEGMSMDVQARDLEFAFSVLRALPFVDSDWVATTGMSWGGMSNVLFATRNANVDAVVTFDGAITMPDELDLLLEVPGFDLGSLRAAYLQFLVAPEQAVFRAKDLRFWEALKYSDATMLQFNGVRHDDFAPGLSRLRRASITDAEDAGYLEGFSRVLLRYTLGFLDAHLQGDAAALGLVAAPPTGKIPAGLVARFETKSALPAPPSQDEFAEILRLRGPETAERVFQTVHETEPELQLITSSVMGPLYMEAFQAGETERALAICRLWAAGMPDEVGPWFSMARVYRAAGDNENAVRAYEKVLELAPDHPAAENARVAIRELRGGRSW